MSARAAFLVGTNHSLKLASRGLFSKANFKDVSSNREVIFLVKGMI